MNHALFLQALFLDVARPFGGAGKGGGLFGFLLTVLVIASMWKIFAKAGEAGWAAIIPIYNTLVLLKVAGKPMWWILLFLVPIVNFVVLIIVGVSLANRFGKGTLFGLGLLFLPFIFLPMLGFGSSTYSAYDR